MVPLIVLVAASLATVVVTAARHPHHRRDGVVSLRVGVAAMFLVSGVSHFVGMRGAMIAMVPDLFARPDLIVTITGVLELAAAAAMVSRRLVPWGAAGLTLLLVAMFPANVDLALSATDLTWSQTLVPRTIIQLVFIAATSGLAVAAWRHTASPARETRGPGAAGVRSA